VVSNAGQPHDCPAGRAARRSPHAQLVRTTAACSRCAHRGGRCDDDVFHLSASLAQSSLLRGLGRAETQAAGRALERLSSGQQGVCLLLLLGRWVASPAYVALILHVPAVGRGNEAEYLLKELSVEFLLATLLNLVPDRR
jgi:hypothetical protein